MLTLLVSSLEQGRSLVYFRLSQHHQRNLESQYQELDDQGNENSHHYEMSQNTGSKGWLLEVT